VIGPRILGYERAYARSPQNAAFFTPKSAGQAGKYQRTICLNQKSETLSGLAFFDCR
jgi:hypothetical protein